jgi:FkbM family methyltransferase
LTDWSALKRSAPPLFYGLRAVKRRLAGVVDQVGRSRFQRRHPGVEILEGETHGETYSQHGQDRHVLDLFERVGQSPGVFVDVGCNHPFKFNNTWLFEKQGWSGLAVDPQPFGDQWASRKTRFVQAALGDQDGEVVLRVPVAGSLGTDHDHMFAALEHSGTTKIGDVPTEELRVPQRRLDVVAQEHGVDHIHFLSMDVEGYEAQVLGGLDPDRVPVDVICLENDALPWGAEAIRDALAMKGFVFWARCRPYDDIFVSSEMARRLGRPAS